MILARFAKGLAAGLFFIWLNISAAHAHALPGSKLLFTQHQSELSLTLSLPIEDLIFAVPEQAYLEAKEAGYTLSKGQLQQLSGYFDAHLKLKSASKMLPFTLHQATVKTDKNEHVGTFYILVLELSSPLIASNGPSVLELTYDAVMHEVRNHRAHVYWSSNGEIPKKVANYSYRYFSETGKKAVMIELAEAARPLLPRP